MRYSPTIRSKIETELKQRGYTFSSFSKISGINRGTFSTMLNSNPPKPISVRQMDLITKALGYPEGWLYELYIDECFYQGKGHWKRIKPFLLRCVELGREDCIQKVLWRLTEDLSYVQTIFELAEELHVAGKEKESIPFYECVIENEKYRYSERLAISQYKRFKASTMSDLEKSLELVLEFIPYRNLLPERYQLEAIHKITNIYFYLHKWDEVEKYGHELKNLAYVIYRNQQIRKESRRTITWLRAERHLVFYYGYGFLSVSTALQKKGLIKEARAELEGYADLSWFKGLDSEGEADVEQFRVWAKANSYTLDLLLGKRDILPAYITFLENHPEEINSGLVTILETANKYDFDVDYIIDKYSEQIKSLQESNDVKQLTYYYCYMYQLAIYHYRRGRILKGQGDTLSYLSLSQQRNWFKPPISIETLQDHMQSD
ncbi:helix-turn-helix domain-containing protein [Paenibacillus ottowii]|uniref:DNA-binding protein n=1 Tax=Paenibacillus ottowii TaxID=2315729 RepID=A0ABY3B5J2_9BACL|nr:helix-turn-helix transcriptional regulator [Paenibacillus ottowii]TQR99316.1 DNA-binding protein [Paenibacillus ottowii]